MSPFPVSKHPLSTHPVSAHFSSLPQALLIPLPEVLIDLPSSVYHAAGHIPTESGFFLSLHTTV